jgi:hypothetical protein
LTSSVSVIQAADEGKVVDGAVVALTATDALPETEPQVAVTPNVPAVEPAV